MLLIVIHHQSSNLYGDGGRPLSCKFDLCLILFINSKFCFYLILFKFNFNLYLILDTLLNVHVKHVSLRNPLTWKLSHKCHKNGKR